MKVCYIIYEKIIKKLSQNILWEFCIYKIYFQIIYVGDVMSKKISSKDKVSLEYNLELERKDEHNTKKKGYDFVPRSYHWTSVDEQKIKVKEIEDKTK